MKVVALSGGVGGARLLHGLAAVLAPEQLTAIVNTGDDFTHWGLHIAPDLDTCMYTLAGLAHEQRGWGLYKETFHTFEMMQRYGGPAWFQLGDRDLATHLARTQSLAAGSTLTAVTDELCAALGVQHRLVPMADQPRRTLIHTKDRRTLSFQDWLVRERGAPDVARVEFVGATAPAPAALAAIEQSDLIIIGPSNPYVSIDPILTLTGVREAVERTRVVAISPIVAGKAVKGPLAAMIPALTRVPASAGAVAQHYGRLLHGFVVERGDQVDRVPLHATATVMGGRDDRARLAREVLAFAESLA